MTKLDLRRPTLEDKEAVLDLMREFEETTAAHDGGFWDAEHFDYEEWIAGNTDEEMGLNIPDSWVPAVQFVGFVDGKAVGFLNLRLRLSDFLLHHGGHIGYSVRPSQQGKSYATQMLRQGLSVAISKNISKVLVTCDETNAANRAVILKNGGVLEDVRDDTERYWINPE
ncbi:GNAT family N-acetyltransferase [Streptococcus sp. X16XC17]|uniref:GNAT family N-acetyltransferase n=1 Tax=unclassified Streptococcus TaxID=2608887 RepID=UPI00066FB600|nr:MULTISPECIES: GNAT family N-acetyltransferase [unclassified Streptococcus]TCD45874.1 GNAT family N-acetyltransferase [Streptococcus sp. X16XC17]